MVTAPVVLGLIARDEFHQKCLMKKTFSVCQSLGGARDGGHVFRTSAGSTRASQRVVTSWRLC